MALKKKYLGGLKLLLLPLFIMLLGTFSTCYASFSDDYFSYALNTLALNYTGSTSAETERGRTQMNMFLNNPSEVNKAKTLFQDFLTNNNLNSITDYNLIFNIRHRETNYYFISIYICNNTAPGTNENLDHFLISNQRLYRYSTGYIYNFRFTILNGIYFPPADTYIIPSDYNYVTIDLGNYSFNDSYSVLTCSNIACCGVPAGFCYYPLNNTTSIIPIILKDFNGNYQIPLPPEPEQPSGDSGGGSTTSSGDNGGGIDLTNIENGINDVNNSINTQGQNIVNQISGDTQKIIDNQTQNTNTIINFLSGDANFYDKNITSGDIESSLGFQIAEDPYSNFWLTLTNNLKSALLGVNRSIDISFQNRTWTISLDEYFVLPPWLTIILLPFSTAFFTWILARQWKHIFDKLSSGNVDSLLKENSEERYF